jgi:hypothetical protein
VLPDQETTADQYKLWNGDDCPPTYYYPNADGNEYLVTTSFIAPNSEAEEREELCKSDDEVHDIIDRAATIAVDGDYRRDAYNGTPRMVFEYDAATADDLFVNDDGMGNATVRVYGEAGAIYPTHVLTGDKDFIYPNPVDPFDPGVIAKDSVTFEPAYIDDEYEPASEWWAPEIIVDGDDGDEKVFFRVFYDPGYGHAADDIMSAYYTLDPVSMPDGAIVTETTYMLLENNDANGHAGLPKLGGIEGTDTTRFMLPVSPDDLWDGEPGMDVGDMVDLVYAEAGSIITAGTIEVEQSYEGAAFNALYVDPLDPVSFMDHSIVVTNIDSNDEVTLGVGYIGNMNGESGKVEHHVLNEGDKFYFNRINGKSADTNPAYRWYVEITEVYYNMFDPDSSYVELKLGRRLVAGETFYVDGVRYDMPAIYVAEDLDDPGVDKFKYITFQSPIPKCPVVWDPPNMPDESHVTSQWLANIPESEYGYEENGYYEDIYYIWVLPPFNEPHTMIDDIDLYKAWNCGGTWKNISVEAAGNILGGVDPLEFYYIAEDEELRFDSSLAERHAYDGSDEIWNWWSIFTKPYQYTEIVLPDQEVGGNEYLVTTSFIAPNCEEDDRTADCKPYDTHDIIDRASTLRDPVGTECKGDFDGDGDRDLDDFMDFVDAYGTSSSDPLYDSAGDFDGDGDIDLDDFMDFVDAYGVPCP